MREGCLHRARLGSNPLPSRPIPDRPALCHTRSTLAPCGSAACRASTAFNSQLLMQSRSAAMTASPPSATACTPPSSSCSAPDRHRSSAPKQPPSSKPPCAMPPSGSAPRSRGQGSRSGSSPSGPPPLCRPRRCCCRRGTALQVGTGLTGTAAVAAVLQWLRGRAAGHSKAVAVRYCTYLGGGADAVGTRRPYVSSDPGPFNIRSFSSHSSAGHHAPRKERRKVVSETTVCR